MVATGYLGDSARNGGPCRFSGFSTACQRAMASTRWRSPTGAPLTWQRRDPSRDVRASLATERDLHSNVCAFLRPLPAAALFGVGPATAPTLTQYGLHRQHRRHFRRHPSSAGRWRPPHARGCSSRAFVSGAPAELADQGEPSRHREHRPRYGRSFPSGRAARRPGVGPTVRQLVVDRGTFRQCASLSGLGSGPRVSAPCQRWWPVGDRRREHVSRRCRTPRPKPPGRGHTDGNRPLRLREGSHKHGIPGLKFRWGVSCLPR